MQVLVVNGYGPHKSLLNYSMSLIREIFEEADLEDNHFIIREPSQLHDIVVDWEFDQLDAHYEEMCLIFDKLDMIIILGEMEIAPWELSSNQLAILIKMAKQTKKPLLGLGFGAYALLYSLTTKGRRFNFLNGPYGENISKLSSFPSYTKNGGVLIGGFYDQDTGDVYTYEPLAHSWKPTCNVGITFVPSSGVLSRKKNFTTQFSSTVPGKQDDIKEMDEDKVYIQKGFLCHKYFSGVTHSNKLSLRLFLNWLINKPELLPHDESLEVMASAIDGTPVILKCENMLVIACKISQNPNSKFLNLILLNYLSYIRDGSCNAGNGKIFLSLHSFLFSNSTNTSYNFSDDSETPSYDTAQHRKPMHHALASAPVPSSIPDGPKEVNAPLVKLFNKPIKNSFQFVKKTPEKSILKNFTKKETFIIQNPQTGAIRSKRIETVFEKTKIVSPRKFQGHGVSQTTIDLSSLSNRKEEIDTSGHQTGVTGLLSNILNSVKMNDTSVTVRRHHVQHNTNLFMETEFVNDLVKRKKEGQLESISSKSLHEATTEDNAGNVELAEESDDVLYDFSEYIEKELMIGINEENNLGQSENNQVYKRLLEIPAEIFLLNKENSSTFNILEFLKQAKSVKCVDLAVKCLINNEFSPESDTVVNFLNALELEGVEDHEKAHVHDFINYMKVNCSQFLSAQITINTYRNRYYKIKLDKLTNGGRKYVKFEAKNEDNLDLEASLPSTPPKDKPVVPKLHLPGLSSPKPYKEYTLDIWDTLRLRESTTPLSSTIMAPHPPVSPSPSFSQSSTGRSTPKKLQATTPSDKKISDIASPRKSQDILKYCTQSYQPLNRPKALLNNVNEFDIEETKKIEVLVKDHTITRPISNYHKIRATNELIDEENRNNYQGSYLTPYMTPFERELQMYKQNKNDSTTRDLPSFSAYFSTESSAMQIRKDGQIRADGPYQPMRHISSREDHSEKWLSGPWKMV